ncbi:MAG TPA: Spy/CpxP family protein refolding chaperone [Stellaceae bacterium]|nr:Spy/CpxP family protein refolding chaperone [Stellaceae bacterium]
MNKSIVAGAAMIAGMAIASPMLAWSATDGEQQAQQGTPTQQAPPAQPSMGMGMGMMSEHDGGGRMMMGGGARMHEMMMRHMARMSPKQRCEERLARRAGITAYTVAKLNLTTQQKPLWDKLSGQLQAAADKERQLCQALRPADQQTILDRVGQREQFLSSRLQALQQVRPALEQFYQALTPEQQAIVNHPFRRG